MLHQKDLDSLVSFKSMLISIHQSILIVAIKCTDSQEMLIFDISSSNLIQIITIHQVVHCTFI